MYRTLTAARTGLTSAAVLGTALLLTPATAPAADAVFAKTNYKDGFIEFWTGAMAKQSGVVLFALGMGAVCLFIITRAKWKK